MASTTLYVFGDQTNDFVSSLRRLLRNKDAPLLASFLEKTHIALRQEIGKQGREIQDLLPSFSRVVDLVAAYSPDHNAAPVLASTLTAIYQLGSFIHYYGDGSKSYPKGDESQTALGLCTGQLAACAIASASTINELVSLAVEIVLVAFRTGLHVNKARDLLDHGDEKKGNWSYIIPALTAEDALSRIEQFSQAKNLPVGSEPFISAVAPSSVTVSGAPRILKDLFVFPAMSGVRPIAAPIFAPYHESHIYSEFEVQEILEPLSKAAAETVSKMEVLSSVTGEPIPATTLLGLLHSSLGEILRETLRLDNIVNAISQRSSSTSQLTLIPVGTNVTNNIAKALSETTSTVAVIESVDGGDNDTSSSQGTGTGRPEQSKIAIIGYSGRFPDAASTEELWKLLHEGRDVHREIPADRFDVDAHYDPTGTKKNTSKVRHGCFIKEPGLFDCRFFNLSPKEADQSDPGQRMALLTAYEALEMAGVVPDRTPSTKRDRVGMFYGMTSDDWREVNSGQAVGTYFIPGGNRAFTPGRINYHFKFSGPSISVDTACSSSAAAMHMACNSLWRNDCDTAIAGGTNVMTNPDNFTGLDRGHFLSHTGNCKPFDDGADGYCRADAVGTVVLKRLEDALADKDPIQAVICGAFTNHSAEAESITRPHIGAQSAIFRRILNDSGCSPADVSYIEMHGTGTQAGDAVEMRSVLDVFTGAKSGRSGEKDPLYLGSVKANVGHAESASGVTSIIKVMMMLKYSEIPPHCGIKSKINSGFPLDLKERGIRIAMEATSWPKPANGNKRRAFLNNFSAAGGNSALLLEDAPTFDGSILQDPRDCHVIALSAKTPKSLRKNMEQLAEHLKTRPETALGSLAYTTTARRLHHNYRASVTGETISDIVLSLEKGAAQDTKPVPRKLPGIAFAFTGQGSVHQSMGKVLASLFHVFKQELYRLDSIARSFGFDSFMPLLMGTDDETSARFSPQATQLALTCFEIALARLWQSFGIVPKVVVGHSLGEYAALHIAGVITARDTVFLVGTRARIMQDRCTRGTHAMLAVKASEEQIQQTIKNNFLEIACINGATQIVLSGQIADVTAAQEALQEQGVKATKLTTDFAFHSSQVDPVLDEFAKCTSAVEFREPAIPVLSPLLSSVVTEKGQFSVEYLARHCREPVNIAGAVQSAVSQGTISTETICVEIGPDPIVTGMLKSTIGSLTKTIASVRKSDAAPWKTLSEALSSLYQAGFDVDWNEYHRDFDQYNNVLALPTYQWDYKNHWIQYVNNWCLTKGDAPVALQSKQVLEPAAPSLSATCQKVLQSSHGPSKSSVMIESDILQPELRAIFEAHKVNGVMLCPSSAYADIAITLGSYLHEGGNPVKANSGVEVATMNTSKPLILRAGQTSAAFRASVEADWAAQTGHMSLYSVDKSGKKTVEHATCVLRFGNPESWSMEWSRISYLVKSRMQNLREGIEGGRCHHIKRGLAYKLFENCVEYTEAFQGIEDVILDSNAHEATARVVLKDKSNSFKANPYYIDSLGHISGFVMNATESFDHKSQVFINHGWESIRCAVSLSPDKTYNTYVKMQSTDGTKYIGDVYIFSGDEIVGLNKGVAFQSVPRRALDTLLPGATSNAKKPVPNNTHKATSVPPMQPKSASQKSAKLQRRDIVKERASSSKLPTLVTQVLNIVAEETGTGIAEMKSDMIFDEIGIDSLLSLTVCGRLREELNLDVSSTLFADYPTVGDLTTFMFKTSNAPILEVPVIELTESSASSTIDTGFSSEVDVAETDSSATDVEELGSNGDSKYPVSAICTILAEEIGVKAEEVWAAPSLGGLGLDSLMSLTVLGRLREELEIDLPADLFVEHDEMESIRAQYFGNFTSHAATSAPHSVPVALSKASFATAPAPIPAASSVVLQGSVATAEKILFLFPDGSGSATSYATIPRVGTSVAVVGLNCPYMKRPQDMKCTLHDLTAPYLAEVRRRQPQGPYYLGGWSAGGICAYDAAAVLIAGGEEVKSLILIDSPNPIRLEKLPIRMYNFLETAGVFGSGDNSKPLPEWLLPHFLSFIETLATYEPSPFAPGKAPHTHAIWAADGVYRSASGKRLSPQPDDTREMKWLLEDRKTFGPNGWDTLVGAKRLDMEVLQGANHFTMMGGEQGIKLSKFLANSM